MSSSKLNSIFAQYMEPVSTTPEKVEASATETPTPIRARLNYNEIGVCPYCSKVMSKTECCGQTMYLCNDDRFVSPLPNAELDSVGLPGMSL
jgi:hypothetical protein